MADPRSRKLRNLFVKVLSGAQEVVTPANGKLFIEAICQHSDPAICIQKLVASTQGFLALQAALRVDNSIPSLNGSITDFLQYLQAPALRSICGGEVLRQVILKIVDPPIIWNTFIDAVKDGHITEDGLDGFSWLLLQLMSQPTEKALVYAPVVREDQIRTRLLGSSRLEIRTRAHRIIHIVDMITMANNPRVEGPGGRHDNDFADIRKIAILPTPDELASETPFLRRAADKNADCSSSHNLVLHTDSQFRLLREDMLRDMRKEIQAALSPNKGRQRGFHIDNLSLADVLCDERQPWSIQLRCTQDLPQLYKHKGTASRKQFIKDNPKFLKHRSVACLMADQELLALATLVRDEDLLAVLPPILCVQISGLATQNVLLQLKTARNLRLLQLNTAVFAYEPVLKQLKEIKELSLEDDILHWSQDKDLLRPSYELSSKLLGAITGIKADPSMNLQQLLSLPRSTRLDKFQAACFVAGLLQRVSLIQGPPGTGKSFIGSLITKAILDHSDQVILVVCYTHHALDQFLEDLLDLGIPGSEIVRLGSSAKATARTQLLSIKEMRSTVKLSQEQWVILNLWKAFVAEEAKRLHSAFDSFQNATLSKSDLMEHLEFKLDGPRFFEAFQLPHEEGNRTRVGRKGKAVDEFYLIDRWYRGKDAGIYKRKIESSFKQVWQMKPKNRLDEYDKWKMEILNERATSVQESGNEYNISLQRIDSIHMEKDLKIIRGKRIIGCTTTAAAKYVQDLQSISPGVLLVEEAGEILESHILTALGPETKQLLLIGDHKQLRPKVHYDLSVEKGDGYDLNRSLFERLVLKDYPHQILSQQHRMRPELSALVKDLTYPDLSNAPSTEGRPNLKGFQDNLIFVNHKEQETELPEAPDWRDNASTSSKQNLFEAKMTLKCVRYLGQQGYRTDNMVVLTPYLGQLRLLLDELGKDNDPVLNDLDSYDLVRAGLMPAASADLKKPRIRISTIDNYQGEESDIAIVSLTRSNPRREIGFMSSPERVNVMLSRARNALIMIGDAETFMTSRKGKDLWERLMKLMKGGNHIYDGFPVKCERHPNRNTLLCRPEDFDQQSPDGGCSEPCGAMLRCGIHICPQRCHQLYDHSKMQCEHIIEYKCSKGHVEKFKCHKNLSGTCQTCQREAERAQKERLAEFERQSKRDQNQVKHVAALAEIDQQIRLVREETADIQAAEERVQALEQKKEDLKAAKRLAEKNQNNSLKNDHASTSGQLTSFELAPKSDPKFRSVQERDTTTPEGFNDMKDNTSDPKNEWDRQKRVDGASNDAIDALMGLTGLEDVKTKILGIKAKVETVLRQGADMKSERLGIVLLGNPGTGKTTVARLYAKFLASVGVLPGTEFIETTGARLANEGVAGAKKHIESILNAGGGAFFLDEAYQLAGGNNPGGTPVLDFLLAEIENRVGKIVFILAGYDKEMEKFFEHNSGFDSRMPHRLHFADYSDKELLLMLIRLIEKKYKSRAKLEGGLNGLYARIAVRRLGRGRGREGYGNARALENVWAKISERQASRIQQERAAGAKPDDFFFTKEDLIGPEPSNAILKSAAWEKLQGLIGLKAVKNSIKGLVDGIQLNYERELEERPPIEVSLNRIFLGSPGTGKTSVGLLYGEILADIGLLSKREVVSKNPADFLGSVLGESEKNTKAILKSSEGKILIIDEAYMLYPGGKAVGNTSDPYKTAVIDTIVAEVQSTPGEDRCVLLLGYKEQMEEMLENSNPGLARRFPLDYAFEFEDFDDQQLRKILDLKLKTQGLDATEEAKDVAIGILARARDRSNFGNAGEVENLISHAKAQERKRRSAESTKKRSAEVVFVPSDFDENFNRSMNAALNCRKLFADVVGCDGLIKKLESYQRVASTMRSRGLDPKTQIPFNFIFKGPPGTGKTTTARKMGQVFYDLGLLSTKEYFECSTSDLVGQFVGQTGPKTIGVLKKGLGKVLFLDEAYRLGEGQFAKEAIDELVDSLTKPQFAGKMVVILAGYGENMNRLLNVNPGLSSRFPEEIVFENMTPEECLRLLQHQLREDEMEFILHDHQSAYYTAIIACFQKLCSLPAWANGRDVKTLSKAITRVMFETVEPATANLTVSSEVVLTVLEKMYMDQNARRETKAEPTAAKSITQDILTKLFRPSANPALPKSAAISKSFATKAAEPPSIVAENPKTDVESDLTSQEQQRDLGVSDEIWAQLQADKEANKLAERQSQNAIANLEQQAESAAANERLEKAARAKIEEEARANTDEEEANEQKRRHEEARIRELAAYRVKLEAEDKLRKAKEAEEKRRKEEAVAQKKLRDMGQCPVGFRWIKQSSGYRCAGGSHFVSNSQLGF